MSEIHSDWDEAKALAHLAQLRADAERSAAIAEAFEDAADEHRREEAQRERQIAHCEVLFANPRPAKEAAR
ncbi:MAG TPA: hypothetical protein VFG63_11770 [Nocardioidaceae bacterium]|nr:hypothetical protein [Nocardioidaceae bacterium]